MFRGGRRGYRRRGRWGNQRGRGNFKNFGNKNQQQQQQQQQHQQHEQQMYLPQNSMTYDGSGQTGFMNGMDRFNFLNNDAMKNRDMRFSTDDYMEHTSPFKTSMTQMAFQSAPMQQMPTRGKKKNRQKRQREDSQSSNGFIGAEMLSPSQMQMMSRQMALSRPNRPPFMAPMAPFQMPMQHAGMVRFASPFGGLSTVKRLKMDDELPLPPGQGQSKKAQRRKRLRLKQQMEQDAKKNEEETKTDDVEEPKEEVAKKAEDGSPKKERKFRRKAFFWKWEQKPFQCHYCRTDTQNFQGLEEHVKTSEHEQAVKEKDERSKMMVGTIYERNEQRVHALMMMGKTPKFCSVCMLKYCGPISNHKSGRDHQTMVRLLSQYCSSCNMHVPGVTQMDKHNITTAHIRNFINRMIMNGKLPEEDLDVEEYDPEKPIGRNYVVDTRSRYCQACDLHMKVEEDILEHCKTADHFDKFRQFAETRKVVEEERKRQKEAAEEEQRKKKEEEEALKATQEAIKVEQETENGSDGEMGEDDQPMAEDGGAIEQEAAAAEAAE